MSRLFIQSPVTCRWTLGGFQLLAAPSAAAVNLGVQIPESLLSVPLGKVLGRVRIIIVCS